MERTPFLPSMKSAGTLVLACSSVAFIAGCSKPAAAPPPQTPQVVVYTVASKPLTMTTELPGRTSAFQVADVRPQVAGVVLKRQFTEGAEVKAGTSLYLIDPAPYQAQVNSAKAALAKAKSTLLTAGPKADRYKDLVAIEGVSKQDYDDAVAAKASAEADVLSAQATLDTAMINLKYTRVDSPISGRTSRSSVTPGALVTAGQTTALTTVQQLDPMYVDVTQSSNDLLRLKRELASGALKKNGDGDAKVTLMLADGSKYSEEGKLQFADVSVDEGTGNVTLRAIFPNKGGVLLPGMYVRAKLETGTDETAMLVPQVGVTRNMQGQATAMILNKEGKVEQRILKTGATVGDQWVVTDGVKAGDQVIVEGLQKVKPGSPAVAVPASAAPAAGAASGAAPAASAK